jgi:hypothetical protein
MPRWLLGALVAALGLVVARAMVHAPASADAAQGTDVKRFYYGVSSCKDCHSKEKEPPEDYLCRCTEARVWSKEDKHAFAYKALEGERGQRMQALLGYNVTASSACLSCHSVVTPTGATAAKTFKQDEGVSCVACHGYALLAAPDKNKLAVSWIAFHGDEANHDAWRGLTRAVKHDVYGMTDLWDLAKRARLCASCHIGNVQENKVVTHEMYAAGHPPLPGFEVVTFSSQMPRHWQYLKEKTQPIRKIVGISDREAALEETHLLAIGALVALRETLGMLEAQIASPAWPEFAQFDCYACHHELQSKSWRQKRGYAAAAGRPPLRQWSTALVEVGLHHAAIDTETAAKLVTEFQDHLAALQSAVDARPFGDPGRVKKQAQVLGQWLDRQVRVIQDRIAKGDKSGGYGLKASAKLLDLVVRLQGPSQRVPDFDAARQLAWAYQVLYLDTESKHDVKRREQLHEAMQVQPSWRQLDDYLRLTLPKDAKQFDTSLSLSLERIGQYDPDEYAKRWGAVLKVNQ